MTNETVPDVLRLADGADIPHEVGQEAFNYYDDERVVIARRASHSETDTSGLLPGGRAWWVVVKGQISGAEYTLDGSRMVSVGTARKRGWL